MRVDTEYYDGKFLVSTCWWEAGSSEAEFKVELRKTEGCYERKDEGVKEKSC